MRIVLFLLTLTLALPAHAQLVTTREHERQLDSGRVGLTLDVNSFFGRAGSARYSFVQPTALLAARFRELVVEAALPFAFVHENNDPAEGQTRFLLANPWLALAYLPDCECGLSRLSLGVAYDAAKSDTPLGARALWLARGAVGDWDGYLYRDHMLPLVVGASTRMELGRLGRLSWDGDVIFGLPAGAREFVLGTQHAGELALIANWHWQLATRLSATWYPTLDGDDFQSALSLYLRYATVGGSGGLRFSMNLDGPAGFAFSREGVWGLGLFYSTAL